MQKGLHMAARKIVVVGNGMVGHYYVDKLAALTEKFDITVIGAEPRPAYDRVHLSEVFSGKKPEDLALTTREHYQSIGVKAHFGDPVIAIDRDTPKNSYTTRTSVRIRPIDPRDRLLPFCAADTRRRPPWLSGLPPA